MKKINILKFVKSITCLLAIVLFNLPTFAALNINNNNFFKIPTELKVTFHPSSYENFISQEGPLAGNSSGPPLINHNEKILNSFSCNHAITSDQAVNFTNMSFTLTNIVPSAVDTGDFNNDGYSDLTVLGSDSEKFLTVIYGSPDGSFLNTKTLNTDFSHNKAYTYDLNNDRLNDIVLLSEGNDAVSVILNLGNNDFLNPVHFQTGSDPVSLTFGDFTNDGVPDCLVVGGDNASLIKNPGTQKPSAINIPSTPVTLPADFFPNYVISLDFNNDGNLDLVITDETKAITFSGNGKGGFTQTSTVSLNSEPLSIAVADLNKDSILDLIIPVSDNNDSNKVAVALGNNNGLFGILQYFPVAGVPQDTVLGHFNGDCNLDIVTANNDKDNFSILRGNGNGTFSPSIEFPLSSTPLALKKGDLNNDRENDLIFITADGKIQSFILNNTQTNISSSSSGTISFQPQSDILP